MLLLQSPVRVGHLCLHSLSLLGVRCTIAARTLHADGGGGIREGHVLVGGAGGGHTLVHGLRLSVLVTHLQPGTVEFTHQNQH